MFARFLSRIFLKIMGWKVNYNIPPEALHRCVLLAAPHTSNWDQPFTVATMKLLKVNFKYTIKKEWLSFPFGWFIRLTGGIGIDRTPKTPGAERPSTVQAMADLFAENDQLIIIVPPEGSRSLRTEWKTGFYYTALAANVPMALGYLDYKKKEAGIGKMVYPTGDIAKDMAEILDFYKDIAPKFPEKFALDTRYLPTPPNTNPPSNDAETPAL
jgi:1-acyl-sn-glycerol-3-phosphate acyltransferase